MFARRGFAMAESDDDLDATISVRVSSRERARLKELAALDDRPVSALARRLLRQALETQERAA
jgi:predicted transcriptional regulator